WSPDLETWTVRPPLVAPSEVFAHLEVLQLAKVGDQRMLLFCGPRHADRHETPDASGVWMAPVGETLTDVRIDDARLVAPAPLYAGRIVHDRASTPVLLAFSGAPGSAEALSGITDPIGWDA